MAENTRIEWATHTHNPWTGCTKVSPGCANCYAEAWAGRFKHTAGGWGPGAARKFTSRANQLKPLKWNRQAMLEKEAWEKSGAYPKGALLSLGPARPRVFCGSLCDWLDPEVPAEWLKILLDTIAASAGLDWLLLTKRPELWRERMEAAREAGSGYADLWLRGRALSIWVGTSVEDQQRADERIPALLNIPAKRRFLSMEPLLGPVDLGKWLGTNDCHHCNARFWDCLTLSGYPVATQGHEGEDGMASCPKCGYLNTEDDSTVGDISERNDKIDWVIVGGESGPNARPMHPDWARSLREQCSEAGTPFMFKQWGEWAPTSRQDCVEACTRDKAGLVDRCITVSSTDKKSIGATTYNAYRADGEHYDKLSRVGKKKAGRELDGAEHNGNPDEIALRDAEQNKPTQTFRTRVRYLPQTPARLTSAKGEA